MVRELGYETDIGAFTYINAKFGVTIEDHVQIGSHRAIYSVSTIDGKEGPVVLKKGCRIGTHSTVMPGVPAREIGDQRSEVGGRRAVDDLQIAQIGAD